MLGLSPKTDNSHLFPWLQLIRSEGIGPITARQLLARYKSPQAAIEALPELAARGGRKKPLKLCDAKIIETEIKAAHKAGATYITMDDMAYPPALKAIDDAPPVLCMIGDTDLLAKNQLGIVGARNASLSGKKFAGKLANEIGQGGYVITSGLARGIDGAAHAGAMDSGTIAVIAGGVDVIYPRENSDLYKAIAEKGLIISENPIGMQPRNIDFPRRNRIVSGLSAGILVIEATTKSGSLITARLAGEQGRAVFAVPGHPYDPRASGPNKLLKDGAHLVEHANDVLDILQNPSLFSHGMQDNDPFEINESDEIPTQDMHHMILNHLSSVPVHIDELIRSCHMTHTAMQMAVLELELAGRVERLHGNRLVRTENGEPL